MSEYVIKVVARRQCPLKKSLGFVLICKKDVLI